MHHDGMESSTTPETAALFADYFESVYSPVNDDSNEVPVPPGNCITSIDVTQQEVRDILASLDIHKSIGPDGIPNGLLRSLCDQL